MTIRCPGGASARHRGSARITVTHAATAVSTSSWRVGCAVSTHGRCASRCQTATEWRREEIVMVSHPLPSFAGPSRHRYPHGQFAHDLRVIWRWLRFGLPPLTPVQWAALVQAETAPFAGANAPPRTSPSGPRTAPASTPFTRSSPQASPAQTASRWSGSSGAAAPAA